MRRDTKRHRILTGVPRAFMLTHSAARPWGKGKEESGVTKVLERLEAHYEVEDVEMGKVYRCCPFPQKE